MAELLPLRCPYCQSELWVDLDGDGHFESIECDEYITCGAAWGRSGEPRSGPREEN